MLCSEVAGTCNNIWNHMRNVYLQCIFTLKTKWLFESLLKMLLLKLKGCLKVH